VSIYVPTGNCGVDHDFAIKLQIFRKPILSFREIFRPLARYIICKNYSWKCNTNKGGQNDVVHITIPGSGNLEQNYTSEQPDFTSPPFEDHQPHFSL
jgi:hypothetical protein